MSFIKVPDKPYYRIGEVARFLGVETSVLRYWGKEFPQLSPRRSPSGHRIYLQEDIELLREIHRLLYEEEFTIAGAKKQLEREPEPEPVPEPAPEPPPPPEPESEPEPEPALQAAPPPPGSPSQGDLFTPAAPAQEGGLQPAAKQEVLAELKEILKIVEG